MTTDTGTETNRSRSTLVVVFVGAVISIHLFYVIFMRWAGTVKNDSIPELTKDPSGEFDSLRMNRMARIDDSMGLGDPEDIQPSGNELVDLYVDGHNARARRLAKLAFSAGSDWTDFYGGDVLPAHAEFVRKDFRFTWKVGPWHRFHWNGRTGWSDADGGGKFSVDNLNFLFLQMFNPAQFVLGDSDREIEAQQANGEVVVRHVDVLESPDVVLMFDRDKRTLARSLHLDSEGERRTYMVDFVGSVDGWETVGVWIPETISVTFVPRQDGDRPYRVAIYIDKESVVVNGKSRE